MLRNRLGITDPDDLQHYERLLAASRVVELELNPIDGRFDFAHLQAIHHYILQDVYDWAGELRTSDTEIGRAHVCTPVTFRSRMPTSACKKPTQQRLRA